MLKALRILIEVCLLLAYFGLNAFLIALAPLYLGFYMVPFLLGYGVSIIVPVIKYHLAKKQVALDLWLLAYALSVPLTQILISLKLPLRFKGFDAHGFGMSGGELNLLFLPWLHLLLFWLACRLADKTIIGMSNPSS